MDRYPKGLASLSRVGVGLAEYADPDTRISLSDAIDLFNESISNCGDPALGLRAGDLIESGDFDTLEYAARSCSTLREAFQCIARHTRLMSDASEITLVEKSGLAKIRCQQTVLLRIPPAMNDFAIAILMHLIRKHTIITDPPIEIHFIHNPTEYLDEYWRVFRTNIVFNSEYNSIVIPRGWLNTPMIRANPRIAAAFELHARYILDKLEQTDTVGGKTRAVVLSKLRQGDVGMKSVARTLTMSVATLRRHLAAENLSYSQIVEELRYELAKRYLSEPARSIREVAFLLGYSDLISFHKAFKRWSGMTPADYRAHMNTPVNAQLLRSKR